MKLYFKVLAAGAILVATHNLAHAMLGRTVDPLLKGTTRHLRPVVRLSLNPPDPETTRKFHASSRRSFPMGGILTNKEAVRSYKQDKPTEDALVSLQNKAQLPLAVKSLMGEPLVEQNAVPVVDQLKEKPITPAFITNILSGPIGC